MMLDDERKVDEHRLWFKTMLGAVHPERIPDLFPEPVDPFEKARGADGQYDIDKINPADLEWSVPKTAQDREDLDKWIREHMSGSASAADLDESGGGWQ